MKKEKLFIYYDKEGDLLEIIIGKPTRSYYHGLKGEVFIRIDEKTKKVRGYTIMNFTKKTQKDDTYKEYALPLKI